MIKKLLQYFNLFINQSSILVGGQAVIEGVLMRVPGAYATAVRSPQGDILIDGEDLYKFTEASWKGKLAYVSQGDFFFTFNFFGKFFCHIQGNWHRPL